MLGAMPADQTVFDSTNTKANSKGEKEEAFKIPRKMKTNVLSKELQSNVSLASLNREAQIHSSVGCVSPLSFGKHLSIHCMAARPRPGLPPVCFVLFLFLWY